MQYGPITNGGVRARSDAAVHYKTILHVSKDTNLGYRKILGLRIGKKNDHQKCKAYALSRLKIRTQFQNLVGALHFFYFDSTFIIRKGCKGI